MLSLFQDPEIKLTSEEALALSRRNLVSSLNKGLIPNWEQFFHELPSLHQIQDLEAIKEIFLKLTEWSFLIPVLNLAATEYYFHSPLNTQLQTLNSEKKSVSMDLDQADWQLWLEIVSIRFKQNWNVQNPFCSFYGELFGKTYRFSMIHGSTSPNGQSKLFLRHLNQAPLHLSMFGKTEIIAQALKEKKSILIAGATGSGKTSLLSGLLEQVDKKEHMVILEDTYEILSSHPHQTRFLSGDSPQTSLKSYLSYSLRLSPERIILGEMRSHEVVPFLMAMNTGHKGLMSTIHASSAHDAIHRVALLFCLYAGEARLDFEKVMELICRNLEIVVFMENKKVKEVIKILGSDKGVAFYENIEGLSKINLF
jgi:type IV secretory pathway ATPase VirB11/archaellum biosynthesis ATPase